MKIAVRSFCLFLVFVMTLGLFGCQTASQQPTQPTTNTTDPNVDPTDPTQGNPPIENLNEKTGLVDKPVILFMGDSITDGGRTDYKDKTFLGGNHPKLVAQKLRQQFKDEEFTFYSTGVSGDTVLDQYFRLQEDCFDLNPDYIVMLLGINDTWNAYKGKEAFEKSYRMLLNKMIANTDAKIILVQPYLLEANKAMQDVCVIPNVNGYIPKAEEVADVVCSLAAEYKLDVIYLWDILEQQHQKGTSYQQLAPDAIHPTALAASILADQIMLKLGVKDYTPANGDFDTSEIDAKYQSQAPKDPPVITDPEEGTNPEATDTLHYFAVGSVDEAAKTAKVLNGDGEVLTITWEGTAPVVGTVNPFTKNGDVYTAQRIKTYPVYGAGFANRGPTYASARQKRFWYSDMYFVSNETVFFVRYSDTEWRVFKGRDAMATDANTMIYLYSEQELDGLAKVVKYGMVVGNYAASGQWPAATKENTMFLDPNGEGWDSGNIDLS